MVDPWGYFLDAKNHKPSTFSRKIRGLHYCNLAVKERFEPSTAQAVCSSRFGAQHDRFWPLSAHREGLKTTDCVEKVGLPKTLEY